MNLNLCDSGHQEVCFEGRDCPVCVEIRKRDEEVLHLEEIIQDLKEAMPRPQGSNGGIKWKH